MFPKLACDPDLTRHRRFYWSLFHPICLKTIFSIFPLFQSAEKSVFSTFLKMGSFLSVSHYNNSEQFQKDGFDFNLVLNNSFYFLKKIDFSHFWLNVLMEKKLKILKWFKMDFDGWFELTIVNLVGIEYLKVKNG